MAHFAQLDDDNLVISVVVVSNQELGMPENEELGRAFCHGLFGGRWVQTSYSGSFRKNFAGIGYSYNETLDAFIPPKPFASWLLDSMTATWLPPLSYPTDGGKYFWNEELRLWSPR